MVEVVSAVMVVDGDGNVVDRWWIWWMCRVAIVGGVHGGRSLIGVVRGRWIAVAGVGSGNGGLFLKTPPVCNMKSLHAQTILIEAMQNFLKKYDHIPHNEKSIKLLLAEEKFLKIKQVVEEEQTQPEYLQELLQSLLKDLQILNEIQPLKQEIPNQIQKDQEEKSIAELLAEERFQKANQVLNESQSSREMRIQDLEIQKQQCLEEIKEWMNDLGMREYQKEEIDIDYRRKCEDKIYELKDKFNESSI
ncbi:hypothetical protein Tco_1312677 [Tanacetum coccineum]